MLDQHVVAKLGSLFVTVDTYRWSHKRKWLDSVPVTKPKVCNHHTQSSLLPRLEPHVLAGHMPRLVVSAEQFYLACVFIGTHTYTTGTVFGGTEPHCQQVHKPHPFLQLQIEKEHKCIVAMYMNTLYKWVVIRIAAPHAHLTSAFFFSLYVTSLSVQTNINGEMTNRVMHMYTKTVKGGVVNKFAF